MFYSLEVDQATMGGEPQTIATPNMDWLFSAPLLDAALAQIHSLPQFQALQETMKVAEDSGKEIPAAIRAKLAEKERALGVELLDHETKAYLDASGLGSLVTAKEKWDDVHFMAEAHGVGSSIPMVSYTGLSQEDMEKGMNAFYKYIEATPLRLNDPDLQDKVAHNIANAYKELHECTTGEFGGYDPFQSMLDHSPEAVKEIVLKRK